MKSINKKKSLSIPNNTHYYQPGITKLKNNVVSPNSYYSGQSKIDGYATRLYYEFKWCQDHDGQTFFYTLTYNDKSIPKYFGQNCFDYNDLRDLLNGAFKKYLLRHFGTTFKYFVSAELGDGAGSRGLHNNPHYHVLFFLRNANDEKYPYKKISVSDFRHCLRLYWQGFDEDYGFVPYQKAKKGICKEGLYCGLVSDYRASVYCAKYVLKDSVLRQHESRIENIFRTRYLRKIYTDPATYEEYWRRVVVPKYNIRKDCTTDDTPSYVFTDSELFHRLVKNAFSTFTTVTDYAFQFILQEKSQDDFKKFCDDLLEERVAEKVKEYRNRYTNKVRISKGVGDYALETEISTTEPAIIIPSKRGFKARPISLYYYRKLFTDCVKDHLGNNCYVLNAKGIEYKVSNLEKRIDKLQNSLLNQFSKLDQSSYEKMYSSDLNTECFIPFSLVNSIKNGQSIPLNELCYRYALYKLVYEGRFYEVDRNGLCEIDPLGDYLRFISPLLGIVPYRAVSFGDFFKKHCEGYLAYNAHPFFQQYSCFFSLCDLITDYSFVKEDDEKEKKAREIADCRRFHKQQEFKRYCNK